MKRKRLTLLVQRTWQGFFADNCSQMAAGIAYHVLFAIVPLAMFVVALLGTFAGTKGVQERIANEVMDYLNVDTGDVSVELSDDGRARIEQQYGAEAVTSIEAELVALNESPDRQDERAALADDLEAGESITIAGYELTAEDLSALPDNLVTETIHSVIDASARVGILSVVVLAYAASGIFGTVRRSLDAVWDVQLRRPLVQGKLVDLAMLFGVIVLLGLFGLSIALTAGLRAFRMQHEPLFSNDGWLWWAIEIGLAGVFSFLFALLAYRFGPSVSSRFRDIWIGALLTAIGFELLKQAYGIYIDNFSSFDAVYGALGGVLLFMLFINLAASVFLFGAELAAEFPRTMALDLSAVQAPSLSLESKSIWQLARDGIRSLFVRKKT